MAVESEAALGVTLDFQPLKLAVENYCDDRSLSYLDLASLCRIPLPRVLHFMANGDASSLSGLDVLNLCRVTSVPLSELEVDSEVAR